MYTPPGGTYEEYVPMSRRLVGAVSPQQNPERFTIKDLAREVKMLVNADKKYGSHPMRAVVRIKLLTHMSERRAEHGQNTL